MADYIPEDVLINVLMRLPVEAIVRFTLVCKSWFSLITSPNFISHYLNQTIPYNNSNNGHLLVQYCTVQEHYSLQFDGNNTFHEYKKFDFPLTCLSPHFSIVGSCNGLICISDDQLCYNLGMYLWNPCIRKVVAISNPNITFASHFMHSLGFDSVTNDFKVVRIVQFKWDYDPEVEIYSLKSGCWKGISFGKAMPYIIEEPSKQAYVNGVAHWIAYARRGENYSMVSFDMSDEVFKVMSVLNLIAHWDFEKEMHLFPFRESISLIEHWFVWGRDSHCPIWVMKEYGVAESRSKLCRIDLSEHMMKPLSLRSNGEVILTTIRWSLVFYDPKSTQITDLEIHGRRDTCWNSFYWHSFYVGTHKESLVLLDKGVDFCDTVISNHFGIKGRQYWTEWS